MVSEQRRTPRYEFIADAEVTEVASKTKLIGRTSNLSVGGCFIEMLNPSPEGAGIRIKITHKDATFAAIARVVFTVPNMGMGVTFTDIGLSELVTLEKWLAAMTQSTD